MEFLTFTHEVAEGNDPLPVLDMKMSLQKHQAEGPWFQHQESDTHKAPGDPQNDDQREYIAYEFYSKPMSNPLVILNRSGIGESTKVATMTSELRRRWKNTWTGAPTSKYEQVTRDFSDNMTAMGYPQRWREDIIHKSLIGYMRFLKKVERGETQRNRDSESTRTSRRFAKL